MAFTTEEFKQLTLRGVRDPEYRLECLRDDWTQTSNPLCAWEAIKICATNKLPIPEWVTDYLAGAADRMLSAETAESKDARAVLPKILGFPSKRGPGNPLRLENDEVGVDRWLFSRRFAAAIGGGRSIQDALAVAVLLLDPADHDRDELTLLRWVAKEFGLPTPRARRTLGTRRFENLRQRQSFAKYG